MTRQLYRSPPTVQREARMAALADRYGGAGLRLAPPRREERENMKEGARRGTMGSPRP
jgi:hypothetical protein